MSTAQHLVHWFEIYASDLERAKTFYEAVFGQALSTEPMNGPWEMYFFPMHDKTPGASGALVHMEGYLPGQGGTIVYFSVDDCATTEQKIVAAGGKIFKPKFSVGKYGFISIFQDCEGNTVGLHSMH